MHTRVDLARMGVLLGYLAFSVAWLVVLPLCLWQHGDRVAAALPWGCNALCLPTLAIWGLRQPAAPAPASALLPKGNAA